MLYNLTILLPSAISLFGAAWLICKKNDNRRSQNILAVGFLISAIFFLCTANYAVGSHNSSTFVWWDIIDSYATMLVIPVMYLFFRSLIHQGKFTWVDYIWFIPAILVGVGTTVLYSMMDKQGMTNYIQSIFLNGGSISDSYDTIYRLHYFIGVNLYNFTALIQIVGTSAFAFWGLRKYHRQLREFYSDADEKSISVDNKILNWFLVNIPLSFALIIPNINFWEVHPIFVSLLFTSWAVVYFALLYYGNQKRYTADNFIKDLQQADLEEEQYIEAADEGCESPTAQSDKIADRPMSNEVYDKLSALLTQLIDREKIYLKCDLRLDEVAHLMCTNRAYVSYVIKVRYDCSFSDYINVKRIEFSMELMRGNPSLTQDILAEESGYINAQSYSRAFKRVVGTPPKEWLNRNVPHQ